MQIEADEGKNLEVLVKQTFCITLESVNSAKSAIGFRFSRFRAKGTDSPLFAEKLK